MNFVLICDGQEFEVGTSRVFGRADFPHAIKMSRRHFQVTVSDGHAYVLDLGSANGTVLRGSALTPKVAVQMNPGDQLVAGEIVFTCAAQEFEETRSHWPVDVGIFWCLLLCVLAPPSNAWGFALGVEGVTLALVTLAVPFGLCVYFFDRICMRGDSAWSLRAYGIGVAIGTIVLNLSLGMLIDQTTDMGRVLGENKIRYFCLAKFNGAHCVQEIFRCPTCPNRIGNLDRQKITDRLRAEAARLPASSQKKAH